MTPTAEIVRQLFAYNPETGAFTHRTTRGGVRLGTVAGYIAAFGYRRLRVGGRDYAAHQLAWLYFYGELPQGELDHINGSRADNRIANLRKATRSQNVANSTTVRGVSGLRGVSRSPGSNKKWRAKITVKRKQIYLGDFNTPKEAHAAYAAAAKKHFGEFARLA